MEEPRRDEVGVNEANDSENTQPPTEEMEDVMGEDSQRTQPMSVFNDLISEKLKRSSENNSQNDTAKGKEVAKDDGYSSPAPATTSAFSRVMSPNRRSRSPAARTRSPPAPKPEPPKPPSPKTFRFFFPISGSVVDRRVDVGAKLREAEKTDKKARIAAGDPTALTPPPKIRKDKAEKMDVEDKDDEDDEDEETGSDEDGDEEMQLDDDDDIPSHGPKGNRLTEVIHRIMQRNDFDGYDTDDSFIDDDELDDDEVPEGMTTKHGGFFINKGNLELVPEASGSESSEDESPSSGQKKRPKSSNDQETSSKKRKVEGGEELSYQQKKKLKRKLAELIDEVTEKIQGEGRTSQNKIFPKALYGTMLQIGKIARQLHPKGHIPKSLTDELQEKLGFTASTILVRLKGQRKKQETESENKAASDESKEVEKPKEKKKEPEKEKEKEKKHQENVKPKKSSEPVSLKKSPSKPKEENRASSLSSELDETKEYFKKKIKEVCAEQISKDEEGKWKWNQTTKECLRKCLELRRQIVIAKNPNADEDDIKRLVSKDKKRLIKELVDLWPDGWVSAQLLGCAARPPKEHHGSSQVSPSLSRKADGKDDKDKGKDKSKDKEKTKEKEKEKQKTDDSSKNKEKEKLKEKEKEKEKEKKEKEKEKEKEKPKQKPKPKPKESKEKEKEKGKEKEKEKGKEKVKEKEKERLAALKELLLREKERLKEKTKSVNGTEKKDNEKDKPHSKDEQKPVDRRSSLDSSSEKRKLPSSFASERRNSDPKPKVSASASPSTPSSSSSPGTRPASESKLPKSTSNPSLLHAISSSPSSASSLLSRTHLKPVNLLKKHSPTEKKSSSSDNTFALPSASSSERVILLPLPGSNRKDNNATKNKPIEIE